MKFFYAHQDRGVFLDLLAACRDEKDSASYLREFPLRPCRRLLEALQTRRIGPERSDVGDIIQLSLRGVLA